jgi:hypothetical protein
MLRGTKMWLILHFKIDTINQAIETIEKSKKCWLQKIILIPEIEKEQK